MGASLAIFRQENAREALRNDVRSAFFSDDLREADFQRRRGTACSNN